MDEEIELFWGGRRWITVDEDDNSWLFFFFFFFEYSESGTVLTALHEFLILVFRTTHCGVGIFIPIFYRPAS